jgi:EAL domain-containing protein (putative c-di-GMP-specific phosphodiesterase class I)
MAAAATHRDLAAFDAHTRLLAVEAIASQLRQSENKRDSLCFLNFIPSTIDRTAVCLRDTIQVLKGSGIPPENFVLEAVDSNRNPDIVHLRRIGDYLRERGVGFALDDVGHNADALRLVCDVRPDYIKLERRLLHRIGQLREIAAIRRLVDVAERLGVRVVAKGVERVSTMEQLREAGVHRMQGYLFGSPAPDLAENTMDPKAFSRDSQPAPQPERHQSLVSVRSD